RQHATEPGTGLQSVHGRRNRRLVLEPADDRQLLLEGSERLEDRRQLEAGPLSRRRPVVHDRAVRQVHEAHTRLRRSGGVNELRPCRDHGIEKRQSDGNTSTAKEGTTREMLFCNEHESVSGLLLPPTACRLPPTEYYSPPPAPFASGTDRFVRSPSRSTRSDTGRAPTRARCGAPSACRNTRLCGRGRRSSAARSAFA